MVRVGFGEGGLSKEQFFKTVPLESSRGSVLKSLRYLVSFSRSAHIQKYLSGMLCS